MVMNLGYFHVPSTQETLLCGIPIQYLDTI